MYRYSGLDEYYTYGINCIKYLKMRSLKTYILITLALNVLSACGGDSGYGNRNSFSANNLNTNKNNVINNEPDEADEWEEGIFFLRATSGICVPIRLQVADMSRVHS